MVQDAVRLPDLLFRGGICDHDIQQRCERAGCIQEITTGQASDGTTPLEVGYSIGLPVGILLFFNHFTSWKFSLDPTPLEVEMRLYEENVNKTLIQNEERKEDDIDVS